LTLGMEEGVAIESNMISSRIEGAQKAVETQNFESRKHVLEYDDVMNKQREAVYGLRKQLMEGVDQKQLITEDYTSTILSNALDEFAPEKSLPSEWKTDELFTSLHDVFGVRFDEGSDAINLEEVNRHELGEQIFERLHKRYDLKEQILSPSQMRYHERIVMLSVLDGLWKDHLLAMDHLKEGIGLRGYAQQDPLVAYKKESFDIFEAMMMRFQEDTARHLFRMQIIGPDGTPVETAEQLASLQATPQQTIEGSSAPQLASGTASAAPGETFGAPVIPVRQPSTTIDALEREFQKRKERELTMAKESGAAMQSDSANSPHIAGQKVGRNDKCPCGSGKKFKNCHGAAA
jgi:preprotein translocase subunit SecA